jgi:hypothetical protein
MRRFSWLLIPAISLFVASLFSASACGTPQPKSEQAQAGEPASDQPEYMPTATIKDLMLSLVDPSADDVWLAVTTVVTAKGTEEKVPRTDEDWAIARRGAIRLTEAPNLLMMPGRHVARPGEKSETPGIELEPEEMEALINKDRAAWIERAKALHDASLAALRAIDAKDAPKLFELGEQIENACESCHSQYWYPNQVLPPGYGSATQ